MTKLGRKHTLLWSPIFWSLHTRRFPVIWSFLVFYIQALLCKFVFIKEGGGKFISINNRWNTCSHLSLRPIGSNRQWNILTITGLKTCASPRKIYDFKHFKITYIVQTSKIVRVWQPVAKPGNVLEALTRAKLSLGKAKHFCLLNAQQKCDSAM